MCENSSATVEKMAYKMAYINEKCAGGRIFIGSLAETEGFEPSMRLYTPYSLSRGAPSATRSRFQWFNYLTVYLTNFSDWGLIQVKRLVQRAHG